MSGYTRLFSSILASSIWSEPDAVRIVWITMLAMADKHGMVVASIVGLAHQSRKTVKETEEAVAVLSGPDRYSKNPANDGRRIEAVPSVGWHILNYEEYRNGMDNDPEAAANRERQRRHREKLKEETEALHNVTSRDPVVGVGDGVGVVSGIQEGVQGEKPPAPPKVEIPAVLLSQAGFTEAWDAWMIHRKAKKNPATDRTKATVLRRLAERPAEAVDGLDTCIVAGWVDVRWDWIDNRNKQEIELPTEANPIRWVGGDKMWVGIKNADYERWGRMYQGMDIDLELVKLNDWLHKTPTAAKRTSYGGLIESWLKTAQEKGGR